MKQPLPGNNNRIVLQLLLLAVFVLPSLVPTGYMVQRNPETSLVEVVVCSGTNHRTTWLDVDSGTYLPTDVLPEDAGAIVETVQSETCPFAVTGHADLSPFVLFVPDQPDQIRFSVSYRTRLESEISYLPPVRGPPALS
ncbi:MAG: hypothetical protein HOC70_12705 [Gammaproteobacteria bacterium]|nr:hypothetical protein [Gammaproteobacteria bacterium]MBT4494095.1 hypothetical protein [Gammaproteobacteria bacterium]